jgi:hypothetical protein
VIHIPLETTNHLLEGLDFNFGLLIDRLIMDSSYNRSSQSSRYIEVGPNGEVLHQSSIVPPDVVADYLNSQSSMAYNGTSSNAEWSNYPYQTSNKKRKRLFH